MPVTFFDLIYSIMPLSDEGSGFGLLQAPALLHWPELGVVVCLVTFRKKVSDVS